MNFSNRCYLLQPVVTFPIIHSLVIDTVRRIITSTVSLLE